MAIRPVLCYPDPRLRITAKPVTSFDATLKANIQDMVDTMYEDQGCGLAATQIGLDMRIFVMDLSRAGNEPRVFINPDIIHREGERVKEEGCLSFPGVHAKICRPQSVRMRFFDEAGIEHEETFTDLGAACCDHEIQHLDGILFIDFLSPIKRNFLVKKLKKLQRTV
ncbi:MAG: peptide deformylase [Gammaproteobacteria bacterium]